MSERKLTPKQEMFIREYLVDLNGTQAAIRAGYSAKTANEQSVRLLANVSIQKEISAAQQKREQRTEINADYILTTIRNTIERCAQAVPVYNKEGEPTGEYRFDANAVLKGSELLGKHLALFTDRTKVEGEIKIEHEVSPAVANLLQTLKGK